MTLPIDRLALVPQEPSEAMVRAGVDFAQSSSIHAGNTWPQYITGLYKAMIAEALKEPSND